MCFSAFQSEYFVYIPRIFDFIQCGLIKLSIASSVLEMLKGRRKALEAWMSTRDALHYVDGYRFVMRKLCRFLTQQHSE